MIGVGMQGTAQQHDGLGMPSMLQIPALASTPEQPGDLDYLTLSESLPEARLHVPKDSKQIRASRSSRRSAVICQVTPALVLEPSKVCVTCFIMGL